MRTPSPPYCRLDLAPPSADRFIVEVAPIDYGPVLLLMPFGFHLTMDTLPSGKLLVMASGPPWLVSGFRFRARLGFVIPSTFSGPRGVTPAFGYSAPHSSARGTLTLLNNALLSTQYGPLRHPRRPGPALASCQLIATRSPLGLPVLRLVPCVCMPSPIPRQDRWGCSLAPHRRRPSLDSGRVGSCITIFEACTAFTSVTAYKLAKSPT
jgi:hypothetical protein